jgi:hypothetical protein
MDGFRNALKKKLKIITGKLSKNIGLTGAKKGRFESTPASHLAIDLLLKLPVYLSCCSEHVTCR